MNGFGLARGEGGKVKKTSGESAFCEVDNVARDSVGFAMLSVELVSKTCARRVGQAGGDKSLPRALGLNYP